MVLNGDFIYHDWSSDVCSSDLKMVLNGDFIYHVAKILNMPDIAPLCG